MTTIDKIRQRLTKPSVQKKRKLAIDLARKGTHMASKKDVPEWFPFRLMLAQLLLKTGKSKDIEEAIKLMTNTRRHLDQRVKSRKAAETSVTLASAYERRMSGDRKRNIKKALQEFKSAENFFSIEAYPDVWATIKYSVGNAYALSGGKRKRLEYVRKAIHNYREALKVFTKENRPSEHDDITRALDELGKEEKALTK
jgi:hypothetical protein